MATMAVLASYESSLHCARVVICSCFNTVEICSSTRTQRV